MTDGSCWLALREKKCTKSDVELNPTFSVSRSYQVGIRTHERNGCSYGTNYCRYETNRYWWTKYRTVPYHELTVRCEKNAPRHILILVSFFRDAMLFYVVCSTVVHPTLLHGGKKQSHSSSQMTLDKELQPH